MKTYTIIGGVNGVGKSSLTGVLSALDNNLGIVIDANIQGGKIALKRINDCLNKGINFTQETTLSGARTLKTIKQAMELNYYVRLYYVGVNSPDESIARIANRVRKGGHNIPTNDVLRRYEKRFEDLSKVLPYCNEVHFYDNENGFLDVAEYRNGKIKVNDFVPLWLKEFMEYINM